MHLMPAMLGRGLSLFLYLSSVKNFSLCYSLGAGKGILPLVLLSASRVGVFLGFLSKPWEGNFSLDAHTLNRAGIQPVTEVCGMYVLLP